MVHSDTTETSIASMHPREFRELVRNGEFGDLTTLACRGYAQSNLVIVPKSLAFEFLLFCTRNPRPCPVIEVTDPGVYVPSYCAPDADLRTDLPKYRVFQNGQLIDEPTDITPYWQKDMVAFLLGCSTNFEAGLEDAGVKFRYIGDNITNIACKPAGRFHGNTVVSTRVFQSSHDAIRAVQITSRHLASHGPPVYMGSNPGEIGIKDIYHPDSFSPPEPIDPITPAEIVMCWACGVTPQIVAVESRIPFMITHCPGYMFITDILSREITTM